MITKHGLFLGKARLATGFTVLLLAMMFTLTGCPADDENPPANENPPPADTGEQVYTLSGTTFTPYTGTVQNVTGIMVVDGSGSIGSL